jgi:hypothetical protein
MTFLELGTLQRPFPDIPNDLRAMFLTQQGHRPPRPASLGGLEALVCDVLWAVMEAMWAQDAADRPSASQVQTALESPD